MYLNKWLKPLRCYHFDPSRSLFLHFDQPNENCPKRRTYFVTSKYVTRTFRLAKLVDAGKLFRWVLELSKSNFPQNIGCSQIFPYDRFMKTAWVKPKMWIYYLSRQFCIYTSVLQLKCVRRQTGFDMLGIIQFPRFDSIHTHTWRMACSDGWANVVENVHVFAICMCVEFRKCVFPVCVQINVSLTGNFVICNLLSGVCCRPLFECFYIDIKQPLLHIVWAPQGNVPADFRNHWKLEKSCPNSFGWRMILCGSQWQVSSKCTCN